MKRRPFRAEREFGLLVGGIFVVLSSWWIYRTKFVSVSQVLLAVGGLLIVFGVVCPALVLPNKGWMLLAEGLSVVTTRLILGVISFW